MSVATAPPDPAAVPPAMESAVGPGTAAPVVAERAAKRAAPHAAPHTAPHTAPGADSASKIKRATSIKPEIMAAILATQTEISTLLKTERNNYANYDYAPIDAYYSDIVPLANKNGLFWQCRLSNARRFNEDMVIFDVAVDLYYKDGTIYRDFDNFPLPHLLMGAQTAGSAKSYADKIFMRSCFKVTTGEGDADQFPPVNTTYRKPRNNRQAPRSPGNGPMNTPGANPTSRPPPGQDVIPAWLNEPDDPGVETTTPAAPNHTTTNGAAPEQSAASVHAFESDIARADRLAAEALTRKRAVQAVMEAELTTAANAALSVETCIAVWVKRRTELRKLENGTAEDQACYERIKQIFAARKMALLAQPDAKLSSPVATPPPGTRPAAPFRRQNRWGDLEDAEALPP